jgi:ubiquinone/menaquinone biosynthesis C-methylase UbiE
MLLTRFRLNIARLLASALHYVAPVRVRPFVEDCRNELNLYGRHLRACKQVPDRIRNLAGVRLELGGGGTRIGWINVDAYTPCSGLALDLRCPIPFPDNSVESIYSEHVLEHFSFPYPLMDLLNECFRVLKPSGTFSAAVPNAGQAFKTYSQGLNRFYELKSWTNPDPSYYRCPMDELSWFIFMDGQHKFFFDAQSLLFKLQSVGFLNARIRNFNPDLDNIDRSHQTIFVEADKPLGSKNDPLPSSTTENQMEIPRQGLQNNRPFSADIFKTWMRLFVLCSGHAGRLLDVGCGDGQFLELLSKQEIRKKSALHGVEKNEKLLYEAKQRLPEGCFYLWNGVALSFQDTSFNVVVCREPIGSQKELRCVVKEGWRILKPQGRLIILSNDSSPSDNIFQELILFHKETLLNGSQSLFIFRKPAD